MQQFNRKSILCALTGVSLFSLVAFSCHADELLIRAADEFRQKNYSSSYLLVTKSAESPQRTFLQGVSALRSGHPAEALSKLLEAEQKLPLVADYAAFYQAEALLRLNKPVEAAARSAAFVKAYPSSLLVRRAEKLSIDALVQAGDFKSALKACREFVEKYPSGGDSVDALYQAARSREESGDRSGAAQVYRSIWLNNPAAPQADKARERLGEFEKEGIKVTAYSAEELLKRASTLFSQNKFTQSLQALRSIPLEGQPVAVTARIDLRTGLTQYRLRNYRAAEADLSKAAASPVAVVSSEARYWQAKAIERQGQRDKAFELYMQLAGEGSRQEFAATALQEAAGLRRSQGSFAEAARLFEQLGKTFPTSKSAGQAVWDGAWCRYLAGEQAVAAESFRGLLKDEGLREKALYWLARSLENAGKAEAADCYRTLLVEYPAGFYAAWYREQKGLKDEREPLGLQVTANETPLPSGFDKPRFLASLGMLEEAKSEMAAARKKHGDKKVTLSALVRLYHEMRDYNSAIALFQQNWPRKWEPAAKPLWVAGYPLAYRELVSEHTAANTLSQALIYALIRAESCFSPAVKSPAGAIGLMQLMPATAKATAREKGSFDPARLTVPDINIRLGTKHFRDLMKGHEGDVVYSVAAYNAGSSAVERWRKNLKGLKKDEFVESIPYQETRDYVKKVYAAAATYRQLYGLK